MSITSTQSDAIGNSPILLSAFTIQPWKRNVVNKALEYNAYRIICGEEAKPPSGTTSEAIKLRASYDERSSKIVGYIRSTLDYTQTETVLAGIDILDARTTWKTLLEFYQPKSAATRSSILQELVSVRKGSEGHENESYQDYGSRVIAIASRLISLLPKGAEYTEEATIGTTVPDITDGGETSSRVVSELTASSTFDEGYTAKDLAMDLALSMVPIGLGKDDDLLRHTLN